MAVPDDVDREKFYTSDEDDDDEYELEAPDPEVLAAEQRRRAEEMTTLQRSIDIDEIYREQEQDRSSEILHGWAAKLHPGGFRFQVKHMLVATAVLAIGLTLWRLQLLWTSIVVGAMSSIIGVYLYLQWKEKQYQDEVAARRHEMYARRRAAQHNPGSLPSAAIEARRPAPPLPDETDLAWQKAMKGQEFRFHFSLAQLMLTMMAAAVVLGVVNILGPQKAATTLLGLVALIGLVAHAAGFQPPPIVALGWWLLLLFYVILSFVTVIWQTM